MIYCIVRERKRVGGGIEVVVYHGDVIERGKGKIRRCGERPEGPKWAWAASRPAGRHPGTKADRQTDRNRKIGSHEGRQAGGTKQRREKRKGFKNLVQIGIWKVMGSGAEQTSL